MATIHEDLQSPEQHNNETTPLLDNENEQKWKPPKGFVWIEIGKSQMTSLTININPLSSIHLILPSDILQRLPHRLRRHNNSIHLRRDLLLLQLRQHRLLAHNLLPYHIHRLPTSIWPPLRHLRPPRLLLHRRHVLHARLSGLRGCTNWSHAQSHACGHGYRGRRFNDDGHDH
jgi:hypothetical protein